jgi:molybdopterin-guanine dinucleotide biosynthesis protein A
MLPLRMGETDVPIGVVLAGGAGRRIGGAKATVALHGAPLLTYPVAALQRALPEVVVVAKADSELPPLPGIAVWTEPPQPCHPLTGIVHALAFAGERAVLVCAGDLPFASAALARELAGADARGTVAVVPRAGGRLQPLFARYEPAALAPLSARLAAPARIGRLTEVVAALAPRVLECDDERAFFNVNAPEDLLTAAGLMDQADPADA